MNAGGGLPQQRMATDEQYAIGNNRQDAAGHTTMPQNTHMHAEYAPDADETVRDVLEQMQNPLPLPLPQAPAPAAPTMAYDYYEGTGGPPALPAPPAAAAPWWAPSSRDLSLLVLAVLLCVLVGMLPIDRLVETYCTPFVLHNAAVAAVVVRGVLIGTALVVLCRLFGI